MATAKKATKKAKPTEEVSDGITQENTEALDQSSRQEVATTFPEEAVEAPVTDVEAPGASSNSGVVKQTATAKSGKRSAKGIAEAEEKTEKIEHQQHRSEEGAEKEAKPKQPVKPTRSRLERRGKNYRKGAGLIEKGKVYSLKEAMELATKTSSVKFDASVELHVNLGVDPRQADQNIRANLVLPHGTGKTIRVAVFADDKVDGADVSGVETLTKQLEKGEINFDVLVATPANMPKLGKYARLLGPRGLMPNPKSGTVTADVNRAVAEAKAGKVEYRVDSTGIVHLSIGKVSFGGDKLLANAEAVMTSIRGAKPASVKGNYIKSIHAATTMGPSITVSPNE